MKKSIVSIFCAQLMLSVVVIGAEKVSDIETEDRCEFVTERNLKDFIDKSQRDPSVVRDLIGLITSPNPEVSSLSTLMSRYLSERFEERTKILDLGYGHVKNRLMPKQGEMVKDLGCLVIQTILRAN